MPTNLINIKLNEISLVDSGANTGARVLLYKRGAAASETIAKAMMPMAEGEVAAESFTDLLAISDERRRQFEANEMLWPLFDALRDSISAIAANDTLDMNARARRVGQSVDEFLAALRERYPEVQQELVESLQKAKDNPAKAGLSNAGSPGGTPTRKGQDMTVEELEKRLGELEAQIEEKDGEIAKLKKANDEASIVAKMSDMEKEYMAGMSDDQRKRFMAMNADDRKKMMDEKPMKKSADESITVAGEKVNKSDVGDAMFAVLKRQAEENKALADQIAKQAEDREIETFTKRCEDLEPVVKAAEFGPALAKVHKVDPALAATVEAALKAAKEQVEKADQVLTVEKGSSREAGEAYSQIEALAKERVSKGEAATIEAARVHVRKANPDLAKQEREERKAA